MNENRVSPTVAHLTGTYFPVSQNWIHTQIRFLKRWKPIVIANSTANLESVEWKPDYYSREDHLPYIFQKADGAFRRVFGFHPSRYFAARRHDPKILHAHFGPRGYHSLRLKELLDVPLITTFYGFDVSLLPQRDPRWEERYRRLFKEGDLFLVEGTYMGRQLEELGCPTDKIKVHHLGIETDQYPYQSRQRSEGEPLRILMVGRFVEKKGFPDGLRAFARFLEENGNGILTIIGDAKDSTSSRNIKRELFGIVEQRQIEDRVKFRGLVPQDNLKEAYCKHHVLLAPSREATTGDNEGGAPVTIIEAQATGMPVVSTHHCDIPEVVIDGETGLLAEEKNIEALTNGLAQMLDRKWMGKAGRRAAEHARSKYSAKTCGKQKNKIYEQVVRNQ